jgi:ribosome-binding protein aMBF1 (putative translation factor)
MKLKNKINPEFEDLFSFASKEEEIEHDAKMLMFNFLDKVQKIADEKKLSRKELAEKVGTSASYITQLFRGDKLVNMTIIAKFQKELGFKFNISIQSEQEESINENDIEAFLNKIIKTGKGRYVKLIKNEPSKNNIYNTFKPIINKRVTA